MFDFIELPLDRETHLGKDDMGDPIVILGIGSICAAILLGIWAVVSGSSRL